MNEDDEAQDEKMNIGLSVAQRDVFQTRLAELEDTTPPRQVWQRIEAQARAERLFQGRYFESAKWLSGAGIAAAVVLVVLNVPVTPVIDSSPQTFATEPPLTIAEAGAPTNLRTLMVQSQQIERDLRALPGQPRMVRASMAATIVQIEDRIAAIDYRLNHPASRLDPIDAEIYWRERVRLMNSLLDLRRAQAQRMAF